MVEIDVGVLRDFVAQYKATFNEHRLGADNEIYKWKAVKCFQDNWDIDADDFLSMVKASLAQTGNLLASRNYYPRIMIEASAETASDEMRSMFRELFDERIDLIQRVAEFEKRSETLFHQLKSDKWKMHYQTPNSISTYLWLRYPDKYYIFKYSVIKDNARKLCGIDIPSRPYDRMMFGYDLYNAICEELAKDQELVAMSKSSLTDDCYPDDALKTLTVDIGYFITKHEINTSSSRRARPQEKNNIDKNVILYGPPGTGKTYNTVLYAVSIIENKSLADIEKDVEKNGYSAVFNLYLKHKNDGLIAFTTFHQSYGYEEFIEGIRPKIAAAGGKDIEYEIRDGVFKTFCNKAGAPTASGENTVKTSNRVFIIDEINRGNISKIFGELITLIEPSKRLGAPEGQTVQLSYSGQEFGVPENVFIIGTMNTADRSIAMIDTALRRRFSFVEMPPKSSLFEEIVVDGIEIEGILDTMNKRITILLDREHIIGHSYLLPLRDDPSMEKLAEIFENKIMPLLQGYFFDDYEKIQLVLGDNRKNDDRVKFVVKKNDAVALFGNMSDRDFPEYYEINREAFKRPEAYEFLN